MKVELSTLLRTIRQSRGFNISDLSRRTGLARKTITRWEAGEYKPRLTELDSLLEILKATAQERHQCLKLLTAPRALQRLKTEQAHRASSFAGIHYGDLLRALRIRRGWTQEQTAIALHVAQSTITRWEHDEIRPDPEMLHRLGRTLRAEDEETVALTSSSGPTDPLFFLPADDNDPDSMAAYFDRLRNALHTSDLFNLSDLYYIALEQRYRRSAEKTDRGRGVLTAIVMSQADFAAQRSRVQQATQRASHALRFLPETSRWAYEFRMRAEIYRFIACFPIQQHAALLAPWLAMPLNAEHRAWLISQISCSLLANREIDQAIALAQSACELAKAEAGPVEYALRRNDLAELYLRAGWPQFTLETAQSTGSLLVVQRVRAELLLAEAHVSLGERSAAHDRLARAIDYTHLIQATHYDARIAKLRAQF